MGSFPESGGLLPPDPLPPPPVAPPEARNLPQISLKVLNAGRKSEILALLQERGLSTEGPLPELRARLRAWNEANLQGETPADIPDPAWEGFLPGNNPEHPGSCPPPRNLEWVPTGQLRAAIDAHRTSPAELYSLALPDEVLAEVVDWTNLHMSMIFPGPPPDWYRGQNWPTWWVKELHRTQLSLQELKVTLALGHNGNCTTAAD